VDARLSDDDGANTYDRRKASLPDEAARGAGGADAPADHRDAVAPHGTLGPARTSMSAVAEHAGVRRSTLYRHFPDEAALFDACAAHWNAANPVPDLAAWAAIADADARLRAALLELYGFYRRTEAMLANLMRDQELPNVARNFAGFRGYLDAACDVLSAGFEPAARAAIGHALAFTSWRSLTREQGLGDAQAAELMCTLVWGLSKKIRTHRGSLTAPTP
jgi:AcrR family transcriptional regulator